MVIAKRSPDIQTQCGTAIVDTKHRIIGMGFNGYARDLPDDKIPNTRPLKYPWILHGEENAILNCTAPLDGAIAYVTGWPCHRCSNLLWHQGVRWWKIIDRTVKMVAEQELLLKQFYEYTNAYIAESKDIQIDPFHDERPKNTLTIEIIKPNLSFLIGVAEEAHNMGLIKTDFDKFRESLNG